MKLVDWLQDNAGLSIVEVALLDFGARRVTMWGGGRAFLEYVATADGTFTQSEAWSHETVPASLQGAMVVVLERRAREESV